MLRLLEVSLAGLLLGITSFWVVSTATQPRRTTPVYDPPVLAGQWIPGYCSAGFYARHGDSIVLTTSPHCAGQGTVAHDPGLATVQGVFGSLFNEGSEFARDGRQFDHLFADGETFEIGSLRARAMHTPGHTPACMTYVVSDGGDAAAFVGDTLFMPDYGTARCDFPGGDARTLYRSINKVLSLPPRTALYMCHDYQPGGREVRFASTVAEEREHNVHVRNGVSEDEFVAMRHARDATLGMPALILPSVQVNMRAGELPKAESNGIRYLKIPLNAV